MTILKFTMLILVQIHQDQERHLLWIISSASIYSFWKIKQLISEIYTMEKVRRKSIIRKHYKKIISIWDYASMFMMLIRVATWITLNWEPSFKKWIYISNLFSTPTRSGHSKTVWVKFSPLLIRIWTIKLVMMSTFICIMSF